MKKQFSINRTDKLLIKKFRQLAIPKSLSGLVKIILLLTDSIIAAQFIGETALSSLALISPFILIDEVIWSIFGSGISTVIAHERGNCSLSKARRICASSLTILFFSYLIVSALILCFAPQLIRFFTQDVQLSSYCLDYLYPAVAAFPVFGVCLGLERVFSLDGRPFFFSFRVVITASFNIALDLYFLCVCQMGMFGLAIASVLSTLIGYLWILTHIFSKSCSCLPHFSRFNLRRWLKAEKEVCKVGLSYGIREYLRVQSTAVINKLLASLGGSIALASFSLLNYAYLIFNNILNGITACVSMMCGILYGEREGKGIIFVLTRAIISTFVLSAFYIVLLEAFPQLLIYLYGLKNPEAVDLSITAIKIGCLALFFDSQVSLLVTFFSSISLSNIAFKISVFQLIAILPLVYFFAVLWGVRGIFAALAFTPLPIFCYSIYKLKKVVKRLKRKKIRFTNMEYSFISSPKCISSTVNNFCDDILSLLDDKNLINRISLVIEDGCVRIAKFNNFRYVNIDLIVKVSPKKIIICIKDDGKLHNPFGMFYDNVEHDDLESRVVEHFAHTITYNRMLELNVLNMEIEVPKE